jgi:PTH1 family peptidyl-tRNA hydrolase
MFIIAGLGNPTLKYEGTRHNAGFSVIDVMAKEYNIPVKTMKERAYIGKGIIANEKVILAKPQTYMNNSGESIGKLVNYFGVDEETELIVIYDDISLPVGQLRIRKKGSAGGHNGIKSILSHLGTDTFIRIKVGVGDKHAEQDLVGHVLGHFNKADKAEMKAAYEDASDCARLIVAGELDKAMNLYNTKKN